MSYRSLPLRSSYMLSAGTLVADTVEQESAMVQVLLPAVAICQAVCENHRWTLGRIDLGHQLQACCDSAV